MKFYIMNEIYINAYNIIKQVVNNFIACDPNKDDLIQDIAIVILEKPPDLIKKLYEDGELKYYIVRIVKNNVYSKNSNFYYKYKKHHNNEIQVENITYLDERNKNTETG